MYLNRNNIPIVMLIVTTICISPSSSGIPRPRKLVGTVFHDPSLETLWQEFCREQCNWCKNETNYFLHYKVINKYSLSHFSNPNYFSALVLLINSYGKIRGRIMYRRVFWVSFLCVHKSGVSLSNWNT